MREIQWPDGITARTFAGEPDFAMVAELFSATVRADGAHGGATAAQVANDFTHTENFDLERGLLFVHAGAVPIGYVVARWYVETDGPHMYRHLCKLLPEHRGRGVGTSMLRWAQRYLTEIATGHQAADQRFHTDLDDGDAGGKVLLTAGGYRPQAFHATMIRPHLDDIPERPLPDGVELRPVAPDQLRAIWEADAEAFRDHVGHVEPTERDFERFAADPEAQPELWKVAWHGDRVVGQVRSYIDETENAAIGRRRGWTEDISTARDWRGRGVAGALICASLRELAARGLEEAVLGVHVDNPTGAYRLYESLGYEVVSSGATYQRPVATVEGAR